MCTPNICHARKTVDSQRARMNNGRGKGCSRDTLKSLREILLRSDVRIEFATRTNSIWMEQELRNRGYIAREVRAFRRT